jgi:hypothetical protein
MPPASAPCIYESAAVGLDHAPNQGLRPSLSKLLLPFSEPDPASVFLPWAVLWKEARPRARVRRHLEAVAYGQEPFDLVVRHHLAHCLLPFSDDLRVLLVEEDPEPMNAPGVRRDRSVAEVEPEQIHIRAGQMGESMLVLPTPIACRAENLAVTSRGA